jgi:hypothetical protein
MNGWIKLHRRIWENPRAKDPEWVAIWVYLLCHANHATTKAVFGGKVIEVKPGELITGRKAISKETGVNEFKVFRVLKCLKSEQQIAQRTSNASSLISIVKWAEYQETAQPNAQPVHSHCTTDAQPVHTPREWEECKEGEEGKNTPLTPQGDFALSSEQPLKAKTNDRPKPADPPLLVELAFAYAPRVGRISAKNRKAWRDKAPADHEARVVIDYVKAFKSRLIREDHDLYKYRSRDIDTCLNNFGKQLERAETWARDPESYLPPKSNRKAIGDETAF